MAVLDRVPVDAITTQAREVDVRRVLLTLLALVPFLLGWAAGAIVTAVLWACAAVKAGWVDARRRDAASG
jgi:hypothetical protein